MSEPTSYWPVECQQGDPDLFVCLSCLEEVFRAQVPVDGCPSCGAIADFEAFNLDAIREWGTHELIQKAEQVSLSSVSSDTNSDQPVL